MDKFLIIDGNSLMFRAFYALVGLSNQKGQHTGGVFGFLNMFLKVIEEYQPTHIAVAFDFSRKTFRNRLFADYKGTRKETPQELREQFGYIKEILTALGVVCIEQKCIEADDIIGTLAKNCPFETVVLSGDKDVLQLIDNSTSVWLTKKGITEIEKVDLESIERLFQIKPHQVIELKALMGDASDNIPGVSGIGVKTATNLVNVLDNIENIYANLDNPLITTRVKNALIEQRELAFLSKTLATIKTDCEIDTNLDTYKFALPFNAEGVQLLKEYELYSILKRKIFGNAHVEVAPVEVLPTEINSFEEFEQLISGPIEYLAFNINGDLMFAFGEKAYFVKDEYSLFNLDFNFDKYILALKPIIEDSAILKIVYNKKEMQHVLKEYGIVLDFNVYEIELASYLTNASYVDKNKVGQYNVYKTRLEAEISALGLETLRSDIEQPLEEVLHSMEQNGFKIDVNELKLLTEKYALQLDLLTREIFTLAGVEFNINSPKKLGEILFEKLQLPDENNKKHSTGMDVLAALKGEHEIIDKIMDYRKVQKLKTTYLDAYSKIVSQSGDIIHTKFNQFLTSTGRLSSSEPNLQNIPVRDEEGKELRKLFISRFENGQIVSADYNQIELRLLAHMSGDEVLINAFNSGKDVHRITASQIFDIDESMVTAQQRRSAKAVNFGIIYGISQYGLAQNIGLTPAQAKNYIDKYFETYPQVKGYMNKNVEFARANGYVKTIFNRIRKIPEINSSNFQQRQFGERVAMNMPLQGSASDIIKLAMIRVHDCILKQKLQSKLVLQIHDELIIDAHPDEVEIVKQILKNNMEQVVKLAIPLSVDVESGDSWFDV